jgi:hypothetical protein
LDHFLLITCDFLPKKNLELICSTRLNSIPGSATAHHHSNPHPPPEQAHAGADEDAFLAAEDEE